MARRFHKVLDIGETGFLGFRLIQTLQAQRYQVQATGRHAVMAEKISQLGIPMTRGDIQDQDLMKSLCQSLR